MLVTLPMDLNNKQNCISFCEGITKGELRTIMFFAEKVTDKTVFKHLEMLKDYLAFDVLVCKIPSIRKLNDDYMDVKNYIRQTQPMPFHAKYRHRKPTEEQQEILKAKLNGLNKSYQAVQQWANPLIDTFVEHELQKDYTPNKEGLHWRLAQLAADRINKLWFVKRVGVYGSVAKGLENPGSDIDLYVDLSINTKKITSKELENIKDIIELQISGLENKYSQEIIEANNLSDNHYAYDESLFSIRLRNIGTKKQTDFENKVGFYSHNIILTEKNQSNFNLQNNFVDTMDFENMECVVVNKNTYITSVLQVIGDDVQNLFLKCFTYGFVREDSGDSEYKEMKMSVLNIKKAETKSIKDVMIYELFNNENLNTVENFDACTKLKIAEKQDNVQEWFLSNVMNAKKATDDDEWFDFFVDNKSVQKYLAP